MLEQNRDKLNPITEFAAKFFTWMHPNTISIIGFFIGFIPAYFFISGQARLGGIALLVYQFDFIDGAVARLTDRVSKFGEVLDASLDRVTDGLVIFSIAQGGFVSWNLAFVTLLGFYLVSYVRARSEAAARKSIILNVGFAQRAERMIILMIASFFYIDRITFAGSTFNLLEATFVLLAVLTWQTVIFRFYSAYKTLEKNNNEQKESKKS